MPIKPPLTQESINNALTHLESALNQDSPLLDKAFNRVLSILLGMQQTNQYKYIVERSKQNLALTATGEDLENIGEENDVFKKPAEKWAGTALFYGDEGTTIPVGSSCINTSLNTYYIVTSTTTFSATGFSDVPIQAVEYGPESNLVANPWVTNGSVFLVPEIEGVQPHANVTSVTTLGVDEETEDDYRIRVLDAIRTVGGGSNLADHRKWGQEESGVRRVYPYTGISPNFSDSVPGYRTVFVEATEDVDPDGIAPQTLLDNVRDSINIDPETGLSRPCLGSVDSQLAVESIYRTGFYFTVRDLVVNAESSIAATQDIKDALDKYARGRRLYIWGLDAEIDKDDVLTSGGASLAAQQAVKKYGGYVGSVGVGKAAGQFLPPYQLQPGELGKSIQVDFE